MLLFVVDRLKKALIYSVLSFPFRRESSHTRRWITVLRGWRI